MKGSVAIAEPATVDVFQRRVVPSAKTPGYESWFARANHPTEPRAFWIRYTLFVPADNRPALAELWAICFDGTTGQHVAAKTELPIASASTSPTGLNHNFDGSTITTNALSGRAKTDEHTIAWGLRTSGGQPALLDLPERLYAGGFPKAKALVTRPNCVFDGELEVDGQRWVIDGWRGSTNHNWGSKHTDRYAWAQVAGFDAAPDTFLELATAQLKFGPLWTPKLTLLVLRHRGREWRLNALSRSLRRADYGYFWWDFDVRQGGVRVQGTVKAAAEDFVCLRYLNPPQGSKFCLNSKIARCTVTITLPGHPPETLSTTSGAAFEILTDDTAHGLTARV